MSKQTNDSTRLRLLFTGFMMGVADLIPGVSGGTIALLMGIYDELVYSIKVITGTVPAYILRGEFRKALNSIPYRFLLPVFSGIILAILLLINLIYYLLSSHPIYVWSFFFGLIIGSAFIVARRIKNWSFKHAALFASGAMITFWLVGLPALNADSVPLVMFAAGAIAICAMILPGISGSLILVLLGQYENLVAAASELDFTKLFSFAAGAIVGLGLFSRLLGWLLDSYHALTLAFLSGIMIGSLRKVWPWQNQISENTFENVLPQLSVGLFASLLLASIGFAVVIQLANTGVAQEHKDI